MCNVWPSRDAIPSLRVRLLTECGTGWKRWRSKVTPEARAPEMLVRSPEDNGQGRKNTASEKWLGVPRSDGRRLDRVLRPALAHASNYPNRFVPKKKGGGSGRRPLTYFLTSPGTGVGLGAPELSFSAGILWELAAPVVGDGFALCRRLSHLDCVQQPRYCRRPVRPFA